MAVGRQTTIGRIAGDYFGFNPDDATESESVLSQYFPELSLRVGGKSSRGGRLGRSTQTTDATTLLRQKEAAAAGSTGTSIVTPQQPGTGTTTQPAQTFDTKGIESQIAGLQQTLSDLLSKREQPKEETKTPALTSEQETIKGYYQQYLGRTPQMSEIQDWQGTGKSLAEIQTGLQQHPTSTQGAKAIGDYYQQYLGRPAAAQEIKDWQGTGKSMEEIKQGLIGYAQQQKSGASAPAAAPAAAPTASTGGGDREQAIAQGYQQFFGRAPAAQEVADWLGTGKSAADIKAGLAGHSTNIYGGLLR